MLKDVFKKIIIAAITFEAKLVLKKYKPKIVAITGSVGKTSTKEAVVAALSGEFSVRGNKGSYNSEIGVPLTILGLNNAYFSFFEWLKNIFKGFLLIVKKVNYPRILVLEWGADKPLDIENLAKWIKPDVSVVTALGDIPVHVEFFSSPESLRLEKAKILKPLKSKDKAVLNFDDETVLEMRQKTKAELITYGLGVGADVRGTNYKIILGGREKIPEGMTFKLEYNKSFVPVKVYNTFGKQQMYACLAAASVGIAFGLNIVKISEFLSLYESPPGRLKLIKGVKGAFILDDTYNASPMAVHAALDTLNDLPSKRKIAVFGDMMELGKHTMSAHKEVGMLAAKICGLIFIVGMRAKFIREGAIESGFDKEKIFEFSNSAEAGEYLQKILEKGDMVLVKGSQVMRMEKTVEEIMATPEDKDRILVRQDKFWTEKK